MQKYSIKIDYQVPFSTIKKTGLAAIRMYKSSEGLKQKLKPEDK
jgi:hypothetical protein